MLISAVGIGSKVKETVLDQIAGEKGNVINEYDANKLVELINQIKEAECRK